MDINGHEYTAAELRAGLLKFWSDHGVVAEKASKLDSVLQRYAGHERMLVQKLEKKYKTAFPLPGELSVLPPATGDALPPADDDEDESEYDLVVVGSGPHALALVTRVLDDNPDKSHNFWIGLGSRPTGHRETIQQLASEPGQRYACLSGWCMASVRTCVVG